MAEIQEYPIYIKYYTTETIGYKVYASNIEDAKAIALKMWRERHTDKCINAEIVEQQPSK